MTSKTAFAGNLLAGMENIAKAATPATNRPRAQTVPGMHFQAQAEVDSLRKQLQEAKAQAESGAHGMLLDPKTVKVSPWANRSEQAYLTPAFQELKARISTTKGNVQAGGVYKDENGQWVVVFGHRRLRACRELGFPFKALELTGEISPQAIYEAMYMENEAREKLSVYEQGESFKLAIDTGLYASKRELGERLGCSHTWVNLCLDAVALPEKVVKCWPNITEIKSGDVKALKAALEKDSEMVLLRADLILERDEPLPTAQLLAHLLHDDGVDGNEKPRPMRLADKAKPYAIVRKDDKGQHHIKLPSDFTRDEVQRLLKLAKEMAEGKESLKAKPKAGKKGAKGKAAKPKVEKTQAPQAEGAAE